jgi:peptidoglycan/xylan/chitin deacetylase (PgdA/CDA1 family)
VTGPRRRDRRIAVLAIAVALLAGGAFAALDDHLVQGVLARTLIADPADVTAPVPHEASPPTQAPAVTPAVSQTVSVASAAPDEPSFSSARLAPHLDAVEPITPGAAVNGAIVMTFSQPMDQASVESSFVIQPKADGRFVWHDLTLRFEPFHLAYSTTYAVEVRGRSALGKPLAGSRSWTFSTVSAPPDQVAPGPASIKVPIVTYHYLRVNPDTRDRLGFALSVTPADFAAQMDWLARAGYHPITTEDLYAYLNHTRGLPSKPVILTFDDGYADFYTTALPILKSHDFKATAYIVSGFVGRGGYMTQDQIREVDRSGIEIGSHSVTHADLRHLSVGSVRAEVVDSKRYLEQLVGHPVTAFCYPSGKYTGTVAYEVAAAGYHSATTTAWGAWHALGDRFYWGRLRAGGGQSLGDYAAAIQSAS